MHVAIPSLTGLLRQNLGKVGNDHVDSLVIEFAFLEGVVGFHGQLGVQDDGHFRLRSDLVFFGAFGIVDAQDALLDFLLLGQFLQFRLEVVGVVQENDETAHHLDELGQRTTPGVEFFLSALLSGMLFGVALLIDSPVNWNPAYATLNLQLPQRQWQGRDQALFLAVRAQVARSIARGLTNALWI